MKGRTKIVCDFCGLVIPQGERFIEYKVAADLADEIKAVADDIPELAVTMTRNSDGTAEFHVCLECRLLASRTDSNLVQ